MPFDLISIGQNADSITKVIGGISALSVAGGVAVVRLRNHLRFVRASLTNLNQISAKFDAVTKKMETMQAQVDTIAYQVQPNGGKSLADKIGGIQTSIDELRGETLARIEATAHAMPGYMLNFDETGQCNFVNRSLIAGCGGVVRDYIGMGWANLIVGIVEREQVLDLWRQARDTGSNFECFAHVFNPHAGAEVIRAELIFIPLTTRAGKVIGWTGTITPSEPVLKAEPGR